MSDNSERRVFKRINNKFSVKITEMKNGKKDLSLKIGNATNVSASGLLLRYERSIPVNSLISINFMKPNSFDIFSSEARVVRCDANGDGSFDLGIEFQNIDPAEQKKLNYILTH